MTTGHLKPRPLGRGASFTSELKPARYNPRKDLQPNDPEYQRIKKSIEEFGYVDPVIVNADYTVIGGHQRIKVLRDLGHAQIDVVVVDIPKQKEKALNIALNKITGEWDTQRLTDLLGELKADGFDISITGFDDKEFDGLLRELHKDDDPLDSEPQISRAEELRKEWGTELGQLWQCGDHRVLCGDCTELTNVKRLMQGEKADLMVTDPPYGVSYSEKNTFLNSIDKGGHVQTPIENDSKTPQDMKSFWDATFRTIRPEMKAGASYYVTGPQGGDLLLLLLSLKESDFPLRHMLIWAKNNLVLGRSDYHYKHEPIIFGWVEGSHKFYGAAGENSLWEIDKPHESKLHPTMKPVELYLKAITNSSKTDDIVLDPFLGSGTTMIACENLGRKCRGMEIDPGYVAVILQRYKDTFKKEPVLMEE